MTSSRLTDFNIPAEEPFRIRSGSSAFLLKRRRNEGDMTEATPDRRARAPPVFRSPCDLVRSAPRPIAGRWAGRPDRQPDRGDGAPFHHPMDRSQPRDHPRMPCGLCRGNDPDGIREQPEAGRRGTRFRNVGIAAGGQRHVRAEAEQAAHAPCAPRS